MDALSLLFAIARGATTGVVIGFAIALLRMRRKEKRDYTPAQLENLAGMWRHASGAAMYIMFMALAVGLVWVLYFLLVGLVDPGQADYANNISEMIVGVLTVLSIIMAFYQFLREKK